MNIVQSGRKCSKITMNFLTVLCLVSVAFSFAASNASDEGVVFHQDRKMKTSEKSKFGLYNFSFQDCGAATDAIKGKVSVSPTDPLVLPGNLTVSLNGTLAVTLKSPIKIVLSIQKKEVFWIDIPCIDNVGSCTYDDVCMLLPKTPPSGCPSPLKEAGLPCACPFNQGKYVLRPSVIDVTSIPSGIPSFLADGDFKVNAKLYKGSTELGCLNAAFTLKLDT